MEQILDSIGRRIDTTNSNLNELKALIGTLMGKKVGAAKAFKTDEAKEKKEGKIGKLSKLLKEFTTDFKKDVEEQQKHLREVVDSMKEIKKERKKKPKDGSPDGSDPKKKLKRDTDEAYFYAIQKMHQMEAFSTKIQNTFLGFDSWSTAIGGVIDKERKFTQDIRSIAFQTAGVTKESKALQAVYEQIGTSSRETGVDRTHFQESYMKSTKMGIKDQKVSLGLAKAHLHTESQLGLEAGSLHDTFIGWSMTGRMNNIQINRMSQGLKDVARNTGMTGDALAGVVKSSEEFIIQLRNVAQLTGTAATNIIELGAHAKKLGIEREMNPLMKALTSSNELLFKASDQTRATIFMAAASIGKVDKVMKGTMLHTKQGMRDMTQGYKNVLKQLTGIEKLSEIDNMSDDAKFQANLKLENITGMGLGQWSAMIEANEAASKGAAERLKEYTKEMAMATNTEERATAAEKQRALITSTNLNALASFSEAAKGTNSMSEALEKYAKKSDAFKDDLEAMGQKTGDAGQMMQGSFEAAVKNIDEGLRRAGKDKLGISGDDIKDALKDKDKTQALIGKLQKGNNILNQAQKDQLDPMTKMYRELQAINDNTRVFSQGLFGKLFNSFLGQLVAVGGVLLGIVSGLSFLGLKFARIGHIFSNLMERLSPGFAARLGGHSAAHATATGAAHAAQGGRGMGLAQAGIEGVRGTGNAMKKGATAAGEGIIKASDNVAGKIMAASEKGFTKTFGEMGAKITKTTTEMFKDVSSGVGKLATEAPKMIGEAFTGAKKNIGAGFAKIGKGIKDVPAALAKIPQVLNPKSLAMGASAVTKGAGRAAGGLLKLAGVMNPFGLVVMAAFAAVDGLTGAMNAAERAGDIFGKSIEDVTLTEEYSAKAAGGLIGILDGLTFGLLGMVAPLDSWTESLSRFFAKVPIFTAILAPIIIQWEMIWGVIKGVALGVWEVIKGIWNGIKNIINPIVDAFSNIFKAIGNALGMGGDKASALTRTFRELGGVVGIISGALKWVGKTIGWVFRQIGAAIGWVVTVVGKYVEGFMVVFEPIGETLTALWEGIKDIAGSVGDIFQGIWDSVKPLKEGLMSLFGEGAGGGFMEAIKKAGSYLGQFYGFIVRFLIMPLTTLAKVFKFVAVYIQAAAEGIIEPFQEVFNALWDGIKEIKQGVTEVFDSVWEIIKPIKEQISSIIEQVSSMFGSGGSGTGLMDFIKQMGKAMGQTLGFMIKIVLQPLMIIAKVLGALGKYYQAIAKMFKGDFKGAGDLLKSAFQGILDAITWPFKGIINFFKDKGSSILDWFKSLPGRIFGFFAELPTTIANKIMSLGDVVYNTFSTALKKVVDYVLDLIPGGKKIAEVAGKAGGFISGAKERVGKVLDYINPFADGTRSIEKTGIGLLHKDEMVIPANEIEGLSAVGSGAFGKGAEAHGVGMFSQRNQANAIEKQAREAGGKQPLGYRLANAANALQIAARGMMPSTDLPGVGLMNHMNGMLGNLLPSASNAGSGLMSMFDNMPSLPSIINNIAGEPVTPSVQTSRGMPDIHNVMQAERAANSPSKSEVVSPELKEIADESSEQTDKLSQLVDLFQQVVNELKGTTSSGGRSGAIGNTPNSKVTHKPANYFRNTVGLVTKSAAKNVLSVGTNATT